VLKVSDGLSCPNTFNQEGEHMDFKKLFRKDDKAVSPVIGVILMVAITVILAAAIGSSVFGQGTTKSAPQANIDVKAGAAGESGKPAYIKLEHLGGGTLDFGDLKANITVSVNGGDSVQVLNTDLGTLEAGGVKNVPLKNMKGENIEVVTDSDYIDTGDTVYVKITDSQTNQLLSDRTVKFL
jgi:flagellin-like protein